LNREAPGGNTVVGDDHLAKDNWEADFESDEVPQ